MPGVNCPFTPSREAHTSEEEIAGKEKKRKKKVFYLEPEPGQSERQRMSPPFRDSPRRMVGSRMGANYSTTELCDPRQTAYPLCASQLGLHQYFRLRLCPVGLRVWVAYSVNIFCIPTGHQVPVHCMTPVISDLTVQGGFLFSKQIIVWSKGSWQTGWEKPSEQEEGTQAWLS